MRIAQFVENLDAGGAEGLAVDIANALEERGHESTLITLDGRGPFRGRIGQGVVHRDLGFPRRHDPFPINLTYFFQAYRAVRNAVADNGIEVVQTHLPKANFLGLALAGTGSARVFPTVHNNREFDYGDPGIGFKDFLRKKAYRLMLAKCRSMIAVSPQVRLAMLEELGVTGKPADRLVVVPNGVAVPEPMAPAMRADIRRKWSVGETEVLVVGVGRLTRQKNFEALLEALTRLPDTVSDWKCIIAGDGELRESLATGIMDRGLEDKVVLAGHVADVRALLGAADVFCLSSLFEGLPLVLLEAMASGLPVCAYSIDGVVDVVTDGVQAALADPEDTGQLAEALASLLDDPPLREKMGAAGRNLVLSRFDFRRVVTQLEELFGA